MFGLIAIRRCNAARVTSSISRRGADRQLGRRHQVRVVGFSVAQKSAFGIKVTVVGGPVRTDWARRSLRVPHPSCLCRDHHASKAAERTGGHQPGDPRRAAEAIITVVDSSSRRSSHAGCPRAKMRASSLRSPLNSIDGKRWRSAPRQAIAGCDGADFRKGPARKICRPPARSDGAMGERHDRWPANCTRVTLRSLRR
jgi:hypothetical protein